MRHRPTFRDLIATAAALLTLAVIAGCEGCTGPSKAFTTGIKPAVADIAVDLDRYAAGDAGRMAQVAELRFAAGEKPPQPSRVSAAWAAVAEWYPSSFEADPAVNTDPDALRVRRDNVARLERVIGREMGGGG